MHHFIFGQIHPSYCYPSRFVGSNFAIHHLPLGNIVSLHCALKFQGEQSIISFQDLGFASLPLISPFKGSGFAAQRHLSSSFRIWGLPFISLQGFRPIIFPPIMSCKDLLFDSSIHHFSGRILLQSSLLGFGSIILFEGLRLAISGCSFSHPFSFKVAVRRVLDFARLLSVFPIRHLSRTWISSFMLRHAGRIQRFGPRPDTGIPRPAPTTETCTILFLQ